MIKAFINGVEFVAAHGGPRKAQCRDCKEEVFLRCPEFIIPHWVHHANSKCVHAGKTGPETEWHKGWKHEVPKEFREKSIRRNGKLRRADIYAATRTVIELQHSHIPSDEVSAREEFYGKNMFWMFDSDGRRRVLTRYSSTYIQPIVPGMPVFKCEIFDTIAGLYDAERAKLIDMNSDVVRIIPYHANGPRQFLCHIMDAGVVRSHVQITCDKESPAVHPFLMSLSPDWAPRKLIKNAKRFQCVSKGKYATEYCPHGYIAEDRPKRLDWQAWSEIINDEDPRSF